MKALHCPNCGTPFVRVTYHEGAVERLLNRVNMFSFRCQLCTNRFRAFRSGIGINSQVFDRRQYKRLSASIEAQYLSDSNSQSTNRVTDISMDGCTLQAAGLHKGAFLELVLKPTSGEAPIKIDTAMVCSVRPASIGLRFVEVPALDRQRLRQVVLGLLVSQKHTQVSNP
jgi:c-di-GMP-binding flagellar brake protein YcgR